MEGRVGFKHSESDCRTHDSDQFGFEGEEGGGVVMGMWWYPDQNSLSPFSPSPSLQWPCGVGHPGEQPTGVEGGAATSSTVSVQRDRGLGAGQGDEGHAWLGR